MERRDFLKLSAAALGGAGLGPGASSASASAPAVLRPRSAAPEVVVIGAGAFGAWTAWDLRSRGVEVTLVDAYGPGNPRATSGGDTRQIRPAYGDREMYSRWAVEALERWKRYEREWEEPLLIPTGRVSLAPEVTSSIRSSQAVLQRLGVPHEVISGDEVARRWPQIAPGEMQAALVEPTAAAIRAALALRTLAREFERRGGELRIARARPAEGPGARLGSVTLEGEGGGSLSAQTFVFALGPWLPRMFPEVLGGRISHPRRDVFYFGTPAGDTRFTWPNLPNFSEDAFYGFPSIDFRGVKVCPVGGNVQFDPDTDERVVAGYQIKRARDFLARRLPALADQPVIESRVCQLEDTADEHFIIDRHPRWENVWIAGGGTGHAFKHGPVLGEYIARRVLGEPTETEYDRAFALARFAS